VIVADTHAWLWWLSRSVELSAAAGAALDHALDDAALGVSAISVWEAAMLVKEERLVLALHLDELVAHCETLEGL
jgi:PIN domain nuclease of toxin-antitoxin system